MLTIFPFRLKLRIRSFARFFEGNRCPIHSIFLHRKSRCSGPFIFTCHNFTNITENLKEIEVCEEAHSQPLTTRKWSTGLRNKPALSNLFLNDTEKSLTDRAAWRPSPDSESVE